MNIISIVLPIIFMLGIGKFLGVTRMINDEVVTGIKTIITNIMLPVTLFNALATTTFKTTDLLLVGGVFLAFTAILFIAMLLRPIFGEYRDYAPFLCVGAEGGMLGYSLYMALFGNDALGTILRVDMANILFAFTVFLFAIRSVGEENVDKMEIIKGYVKNPIVISVLLGLIFSMTGLGNVLVNSAIGATYSTVVTMITAPLGAMVLITVGFGLEFDKDVLAAVFKVSAVRLVLQLAFMVVILFLFKPYWSEKALFVAVILEFLLPAQFITPIYIEDAKQQKFASTTLSVYSLITIAAYIILIGVVGN